MRPRYKIATLGVVLLALLAVLVFKPRPDGTQPGMADATATGATLPRLVDLGATSCVPCRMMAPILDELRDEFAGRFEVTFIDVWQQPQAGEPYGIRVIPTQIFFAADGRELFRHEGFFSREQILGTWQALGYPFAPQAAAVGEAAQ